MNDPSAVLTVAEVARELRISDWSVRREIEAGALRAIRVGKGTIRILREDFNEYVRSKKGGGA